MGRRRHVQGVHVLDSPRLPEQHQRPDVEQRAARGFWQRLLLAVGTRPPVVWLALGLLLTSPALTTGWVADDYIHLLSLRERPGLAGIAHHPLDLFRFADGDARAARELMEQGVFPWWADLEVRLAFFRPLASLTHALDAWLWPSSSFAMHAHSLLWFAALLAGVGLSFKALTSSTLTAGLALALFAVDDAHASAAGWLANRNALVALALSVPALVHHDAWRRTGRKASAWIAHGCFALGLAGGETATMIAAYLAAYALFLDGTTARRRIQSLLGYASILLLWRVLYSHLGYGAVGSGLYVDPGLDPWSFLRSAGPRFLTLLLALFWLPWSDFWELYPDLSPALQPALLAFAGAVLSALGALSMPALRSRRTARFWLFGCVASVIPACAAFPHDRLLLGPSIGGAAFLAEVLQHTLALGAAGPLGRAGAKLLLGFHLLLAPFLCLFRAASVGHMDELLRAQDATLPHGASIRDRTLVLLNPALDPFAAYLAPYRELHGLTRPRALYWLATGVSELHVTRVDQHTLSVRPRNGYLWSASQRMLRSPSPHAWRTPLALNEATFEVRALTLDGRPAEVQVRFREALGDPSLTFMRWAGAGYVDFVPPDVGHSVVIPAVDLRAAFGG